MKLRRCLFHDVLRAPAICLKLRVTEMCNRTRLEWNDRDDLLRPTISGNFRTTRHQ